MSGGLSRAPGLRARVCTYVSVTLCVGVGGLVGVCVRVCDTMCKTVCVRVDRRVRGCGCQSIYQYLLNAVPLPRPLLIFPRRGCNLAGLLVLSKV